jgi:hypothetical protein
MRVLVRFLLAVAIVSLFPAAYAGANTLRAHLTWGGSSDYGPPGLTVWDTEFHGTNSGPTAIPRATLDYPQQNGQYLNYADFYDVDEPSVRTFCFFLEAENPLYGNWTNAELTVIDPNGQRRILHSHPEEATPFGPTFINLGSSPPGVNCLPTCNVDAASPQSPAKPIVFSVTGESGACSAKLKKAVLKIGKKSYRYIKPKASKEVAEGETWKVSIAVGGKILKKVKKALAKGLRVKMTADFEIDGEVSSTTVVLGSGGSHGGKGGDGDGGHDGEGGNGNGGNGGQLRPQR